MCNAVHYSRVSFYSCLTWRLEGRQSSLGQGSPSGPSEARQPSGGTSTVLVSETTTPGTAAAPCCTAPSGVSGFRTACTSGLVVSCMHQRCWSLLHACVVWFCLACMGGVAPDCLYVWSGSILLSCVEWLHSTCMYGMD